MGKEKSIIDNRLRKLRFEHGELSQSALASMVGVSRQTIVSIEKGAYSPSLELAFRIAYVFGKRVDEVFHFDPTKVKGGIEKL